MTKMTGSDGDGEPVVLVVMGVSGSGKTTVAMLLARELGWQFQEGDALHSQANIERMSLGQALDDDDRQPWLVRVADWIDEQLDAGRNGVVTCSALKRSYRQLLNRRGSGVIFVDLSVTPETIAARLAAREGHFMPQSLLASQFADLEQPGEDEPAIRVDASLAPAMIVRDVIERLQLTRESARSGRE